MIRTSTPLERALLLAALCALLLGISFAVSAKSPEASEIFVTSHIDHVVVYEQGAQVERIAQANLRQGTNVLVFEDLHTAIDPSRIRLTGRGNFTVLGISHRYHTDTLGGAEAPAERDRLNALRNRFTRDIQ
ncbi:MAG: DUF4140 domain-containing protein, partial [Bacteroidetes bacterium]|nr:DUF4140 domain-containing protein [Bacteroidota bacterium]